MKKTCFLIIPLLIISILSAQTPQAFKYQAIARDEAGNILPNWNIGLRISIVENTEEGQAVYEETQEVTSNLYGLISLAIGEGNIITGDIKTISWGKNRYFIRLEMDINGGEDYKNMGTTQLYAVPYALYAEQAGVIVESERKQTETPQKNPRIQQKNTGGSRIGTPNTKFPAKGHSFTNIDYGNLGVGTTTPAEKLEVNGNIKANIIFLTDSKGNQWELVVDSTGGFHIFDRFQQCGDSLYDLRDGKYYQTVRIDIQCWMAENLNIGNRIDGINDQTDNGNIEKYCYSNLETNCDDYGGLYQWNEMMDYVTTEGASGICPEGFHVPTDNEWKVLEGNVDSYYGVGDPVWDGTGDRGFDAGYHLKSTTGWYSGGNGDDSFGFRVLPAGDRDLGGGFQKLGTHNYIWNSTTGIKTRVLYYGHDQVNRINQPGDYGFPVRCIKDFVCDDSLIDYRDWKKYGTILIGTQCWMSQNLNVGDRIDGVNNQINNSNIEKYCFADLETNCDEYGGLYQWDEMMDYTMTEGSRGICPTGFHIPADEDWTTLTDYLGGLDVAGGKMKSYGTIEAGTGLWYDPNEGATNSSGYNGLPGGLRGSSSGSFYDLGYCGHFWSSTEGGASSAWSRYLHYYYVDVLMYYSYKTYGFSVRCLQDSN